MDGIIKKPLCNNITNIEHTYQCDKLNIHKLNSFRIF